jgi:hypothetical protein
MMLKEMLIAQECCYLHDEYLECMEEELRNRMDGCFDFSNEKLLTN